VYDFHHPAQKLRKFLWDIFASNYIELVKARAYNKDKNFSQEDSESARYSLHFLLERFLILLYPIVPQISSLISREKGIELLNAKWPKSEKKDFNLNLVEEIITFNKEIWKKKKDQGISLKAEIKGIIIPENLKRFEKDLIATHNIF
jgi:valyl-tRNA synthetase